MSDAAGGAGGAAASAHGSERRMTNVDIVGVQMDLGASRRGVDMGPSAIRLAGLADALRDLGFNPKDLGSVSTTTAEETKASQAKPSGERINAHYHLIVGEVAARLSLITEKSAAAGHLPLVLGGDHSIAAGSLAGTQRARHARGLKPAGLIWMDAHTDINTPETSPSGNLHGMPVAALLGLNVPGLSGAVGGKTGTFDPSRMAYVGIRDVDAGERVTLRRFGFVEGRNLFTMSSIDKLGMHRCMEMALAVAAPAGGDKFCLSFDIDSMDPSEAPGVGTPVEGGLTFREGHLAMEMIGAHGGMVHMDVVEVNPVIDISNRTAKLAVHFVQSAFGLTTVDPLPRKPASGA